jgi:hypothetical protein
MGTTPTTHADRIQRSLRRLGFRLFRTARTFKIMDTAGTLAVNSKPAMSLVEIKVWIADLIRPGGKRRRKTKNHARTRFRAR